MAILVKQLVGQLPLSTIIAPIGFSFVNILFFAHGEGLLKTLTVGELINGYPFRLLDTVDTLTKPLTWFGIELPDNGMPGNRYGILSVKNFTKGIANQYEIYTGQGATADRLQQYLTWKDKGYLKL